MLNHFYECACDDRYEQCTRDRHRCAPSAERGRFGPCVLSRPAGKVPNPDPTPELNPSRVPEARAVEACVVRCKTGRCA
jgi:hypothetical protein